MYRLPLGVFGSRALGCLGFQDWLPRGNVPRACGGAQVWIFRLPGSRFQAMRPKSLERKLRSSTTRRVLSIGEDIGKDGRRLHEGLRGFQKIIRYRVIPCKVLTHIQCRRARRRARAQQHKHATFLSAGRRLSPFCPAAPHARRCVSGPGLAWFYLGPLMYISL